MSNPEQLHLFSDENLGIKPKSIIPKKEPKNLEKKDFGIHLLALGRVKGVGINALRALVTHYSDISLVWDAEIDVLQEILREAKIKNAEIISQSLKIQQTDLIKKADKEFKELQLKGIQILSSLSPEFPKQFANFADAPHWLFVQGNISALKEPLIGIVGTRTPTRAGNRAAIALSGLLASEGLGIVSGLAEGIDNTAHRIGLYYSVPQVAVLGTGINMEFPATTRDTRTRLVESGSGVIITEYLPGELYSKAQFVERNRIQALLSSALVPVESKLQSGTAHTVRFAEKYKRPIFGVHIGTVPPENELINLLLERNYNVFNLNSNTEASSLIKWLKKQVIPANLWPEKKLTVNRESLFQQFLKQVEEMIELLPLTESDGYWLQQQIASRFYKKISDLGEDINAS